jgi:hypothetical protein
MALYKSPRHLRLMRIETWAKERFERHLGQPYSDAALRAAQFYERVSGLLYRDVIAEVTPYRD